jgi:hypothetical protein
MGTGWRRAKANALFAWLISHQPAVLFSHNKSATSNQPAILFSQNKPAPATNHQPNEQTLRTRRPPHDAAATDSGLFSTERRNRQQQQLVDAHPAVPDQALLQPAAKSAPVTLPSVHASARKHHHRMSLLQVLSAPASPRSPSRFDWGGDRLLCFFQPRRKGGGRKERERAGEERG